MRPHLWYKTVRDIACLEKMHQAFEKGLMTYGMFRATKKASSGGAKAEAVSTTAV
jgi:MPBQ/MSBQ methyltransferase